MDAEGVIQPIVLPLICPSTPEMRLSAGSRGCRCVDEGARVGHAGKYSARLFRNDPSDERQ